jgi:hypothetical protein
MSADIACAAGPGQTKAREVHLVASEQSQQEERNRIFGIPIGADRPARQLEEHQRVLGFPVDWFRSVDLDWLRPLAHLVRACKRWARRGRRAP